MRRISICSVALTSLALASAALAQTAVAPVTPVAVKQDALIKTSDKRLLGRIDHVTRKDGVAISANVIVDSRIVPIPVATIADSGTGLTTSLTYAEVRKLK